MTKNVRVTQIEKKYKDKKTGEERKITINFAKVVDRLNKFREDNPRGKIETNWHMEGDYIVFKTYILKDKADSNSAEATGHAMAERDGTEKQFEKLETISVGRALALLGYGASGEVASFEEMEEFTAFRDNKITEIVDAISVTKTIAELREYFMSLGSYMAESRVIDAKDKRKEELSNADSRSKAE